MRSRPVQLALAVASLLAGGCGVLSFPVAYDLPEQRIAGSPLGGVLPSFVPSPIPLQIDLKAEAQKHGTGPASHAYLASLSLSATPHNAPSGTFDFLEEVHVFVSAPNAPSLPKQEIATLKPVPRGQTTVSFTPNGSIDLVPYINAGAQIDAAATGTQPRMDFSYDGHLQIDVKI